MIKTLIKGIIREKMVLNKEYIFNKGIFCYKRTKNMNNARIVIVSNDEKLKRKNQGIKYFDSLSLNSLYSLLKSIQNI